MTLTIGTGPFGEQSTGTFFSGANQVAGQLDGLIEASNDL